MSTSRFEPDSEQPYGICPTCDLVLPTVADGREHMRSTVQPVNDPKSPGITARGHSISVTNRTREDRIRDWVSDVEREAVDDAVEEILNAIDANHLTAEEALAAGYCNGLVRDELEEALA